MQKNNQTKKSNPTGNSGRPQKKDTKDLQKKSKNTKTGRRTPSKPKPLTASTSITDHGATRTAEEIKPADNKKLVTKKRQIPKEKEMKLEPTQEDPNVEKKEEKKEEKNEKDEIQSGMSGIVKDDKKESKNDDGYEDFGPGVS